MALGWFGIEYKFGFNSFNVNFFCMGLE